MDDGKKVWVPHPTDGFKLGKIVDISSDGVVVEVISRPGGGQKITAPFDRVFPADEYEDKDVDDNCSLMYLNEGTLLNNIKIRYMKDSIYTYVANILIAVNPYMDLSRLYGSQTIQSYLGKSLGTMPPHVFAIADKAYRDMKVLKTCQSIIVSGESGAGKTESTKYILKYLTECWGTKAGPIEQRIVESNPLLEAFGNAKTMRNNNSSRFGKFVEIHFDAKNFVCGGFISHYLLEKSRICIQNDEERNYHIFYRMCAGAPEALRQQLKLGTPDSFAYLNKGCTQYFCSKQTLQNLGQNRMSKMFQSKGGLSDIQLDDVRDFQLTDQAMSHMGLSEEEKCSIYGVVAGVLHLGNVQFEENLESKGGCKVTQSTEQSLAIASQLLGCEQDELKRALVCRAMQTAKGGKTGTIIQVQLKSGEAQNARDALAKSLYSKLFDYIVLRVNQSLPFQSSKSYIGILDIAGFEYFQTNSFEQFCINYCNEKLQQFFNNRILKEEQALYEKEGLKVKKINYIDNQDCIDLIETKSIGIFDILDEENKLPRPSHTHFTMEVHNKNKNHYRLNVPRKSVLKIHREVRDEEGFLIRHYAGAVCYHTAQFIEKNNDALHASLAVLVVESKNKLVKKLFEGQEAEKVGKLTFISIGSKFRSQLQQLMEKLCSTGTNFIRCIKPNVKMVDHLFEGNQILTQLQCSGMTTVLELMQQGFPSRTQFQDLYNMYKQFMPAEISRLHPRMFCKALFKALGLNENDFAFGNTKIFFRPGKFAEFDQVMKSDPENLAQLIRKVKKWLICARWRKAQWCALSVIKLDRKIKYRQRLLGLVQSTIRGWRARKDFRPRIKALTKVKTLLHQISDLKQLASQLKKDKDSTLKKVAGVEKEILDSRAVIQNLSTKLTPKDLERMCENNLRSVDSNLVELRKLVEKEKVAAEQERLKKIQEEMEREKKRKEEEERMMREADDEKKKRLQMEANRRKEEEDFKKFQASEMKNAEANKKQNEKAESENILRQQQLDQERLDRELALRIVSEDSNMLDDGSIVRSSLLQRSTSKSKYDFSKHTYAQLRDAINTSCDMELINACKEEFHRRLKVYHDWKTKTSNNKSFGGGVPKSLAPPSSLAAVASKLPPAADNQQRFFKIAFTKPSDENRDGIEARGWWWAHFDGKWIARQMEMHIGMKPLLLIAGLDDMKMCEMALEETGLTRKRGAEILEKDFEEEWNKHGGAAYLKNNIKLVSSKFLKMKLSAK
ncbi:hypothetical protein HELRODRAFT_104176 [Helobdella robusta]|uniref:Uncharacterized protein n=1 Tax=Helobdella robusta TaxID=6412 RepID=T1EDK0_HELRO|nr:hypothetical protein HELRODRAFT_104176 [Helobdella robusta]ESN91883.1 hypothetical protein HELRODRAFT_104176 [Helobdella robusta]